MNLTENDPPILHKIEGTEDIASVLKPDDVLALLRVAKALHRERAASDALVVYYVSRNWPSYSDRERKDQTWTAEMMEAQGAAFKRHTGSSFIGPEPRGHGQKQVTVDTSGE